MLDIEEYKDSCGEICLFCRSDELEWSLLSWRCGGASGYVDCTACGARWCEVHKLESLQVVRQPTKEVSL